MQGLLRRVALVACVLAGSASRAQARGEIFCRSFGQCRSPDSMAVVLRPGSDDVILDANFGLVYTAPGGGWQYTCDDIFPGRVPYRTRIARDGRIFVPTMRGLFVGSAGCGFTAATGAFADKAVYDVAFDPADPQRIWAVGNDAVGVPHIVALSTDGGATFVAKYTFPMGLQMMQLAVAPTNAKMIYVAGFNSTRRPSEPLVMALSTDGGDTWTVDETVSMGVAAADQIAEFLGVSPADPNTVFVMVSNGQGDEIWRSTTQGRGLQKVLTLADAEEWPRGGFSFGDADGKTLYVAGFDPLNTGMQPPGSVYVSHDGGTTWERHAAGSAGPHYRCVGARAGKLYACGGDGMVGDQFYLGVSSDEGKSWSPMIRLPDIGGPNACVASQCAATIGFLQTFRSADAGAPTGGTIPATKPKSGGCAVGGAPDAGPLALLLLLTLRRRGRA